MSAAAGRVRRLGHATFGPTVSPAGPSDMHGDQTVRVDAENGTQRHDWVHQNGTIALDGTVSTDAFGGGIADFGGIYPVPAVSMTPDVVGTAPGGESIAAGPVTAAALTNIVAQVQVQSAASSGLVIVANYDTSITNLGTTSSQYLEITGAISAAVTFLEAQFTNSITISMDFGSGEVDGQSLDSGDLGESISNDIPVSYTALRAALLAHGDPASDLPSTNPVNQGNWDVNIAEAIALGLFHPGAGSAQLAGFVGLSNSLMLTFDPNNRAVSGDYDAIGVLEHEMTEVMGRVESLGTYGGTNEYSPLDLFRYASNGVPDLTPGPGYFSINDGVTNLDQFDNPTNGGDAGDWDSSVTADSFDAFSSVGVANTVSATDLTVMNVLGYSLATACYAAGTRVLAARGEVRVEDLMVGDMVHARFAGLVPVKWIGHRRIDCRRHPNPSQVCPVRVASGAFGPGQPCRDLFLSPDHAVAVDGVLIPVRLLVNGASIRREIGTRHVHYFHIELDRHDLLLADGLAAESYLDTGNRDLFENADVPLTLHPRPEGQSRREAMSCLPFHGEPARVHPVWCALAARAEALGFTLTATAATNEPELCIVAGTRRIGPAARDGNRYMFMVAGGVEGVRLQSRHAIPSDSRPWVEDRRRLGVMICRISLRHGSSSVDVALDDPCLTGGWWEVERDGASLWRWTDGDAVLPRLGGPVMIEVVVGETVPYPLIEPQPVAAPMSGRRKAHLSRAA
jgi:hypothetical protein